MAEEQIPFEGPPKTYVGDSVYVEFDGFSVIITTENGYPDDPRNRIAMEPDVWRKFKEWGIALDAAIREYRRREFDTEGLIDVGPKEESLGEVR